MSKTHTSSIHTDYSHKEGSIEARRRTGHQRHNSRLESYLLKLETLCKEHSQKIRGNRPAIEQLECQRRFFKRICEKQKEKLEGVNLALIREECEAELAELREKRSHMHEMISAIHEQAEQKKTSYLSSEQSLAENRQFLSHSLQSLQFQNQRYGAMLQKKEQTILNQQRVMQGNRLLIQEKQKIEEKYKMVCREIESRERSG